ncbi:glycosyltransferase family 2 protein [Gilvibacter sediminis]|uniref:glycosyltransferase family 2 protein n=1 Tax=Gilvibacter sediminis TaxID=379071 RepID=UPI002351019B|nr:glycosyltransferase family 2 protein [Gilvibacter sediminis]MDC7999261.1 glycosyltransferase family 2 protein [Gilvibacter sediminis]
MSTSGLVSIIIPVYNRAELIIPTLTSIAKQSYSQWECCIVDDGSTDDTYAAIEHLTEDEPRFKLFARPKDLPKGANSCRNYGFEQSQGEFVIFFDSDDLMLEEDLAMRLDCMEDKDIVVARAQVVDEALNLLREFRVEAYQDLYRTYAYTKTEMVTDSVLFRKDFLVGKTLFDPTVVRGQEAEFFMRIFREVPLKNVVLMETPSFLYRQHSGTKTAAAKNYRQDYKQSQLKIYADNLKYGVAQKDPQLVKYMYKQLVPILCSAAANRDKQTMKATLKLLNDTLGQANPTLKATLKRVTGILFFFGKPSYRLESKLRNAALNFEL